MTRKAFPPKGAWCLGCGANADEWADWLLRLDGIPSSGDTPSQEHASGFVCKTCRGPLQGGALDAAFLELVDTLLCKTRRPGARWFDYARSLARRNTKLREALQTAIVFLDDPQSADRHSIDCLRIVLLTSAAPEAKEIANAK